MQMSLLFLAPTIPDVIIKQIFKTNYTGRWYRNHTRTLSILISNMGYSIAFFHTGASGLSLNLMHLKELYAKALICNHLSLQTYTVTVRIVIPLGEVNSGKLNLPRGSGFQSDISQSGENKVWHTPETWIFPT